MHLLLCVCICYKRQHQICNDAGGLGSSPLVIDSVQCELKKSSPVTCGFLTFFHKRLRILNQFLHTYYTTLSTLDYKFLLSYLKF